MSESGIDHIEELEQELVKAQMILAYVLQETGDVTIPLGKSLEKGAAIEVQENADEHTLTVKLVSGE